MKLKFETIGSDPEFVIVDRDNDPIGAFVHFEGTKIMPERLDDGYALLKDNLLIEGNIPPSKTMEEYVLAMKKVKSLISERIRPSGCKLICVDEATYSDDFIMSDDGQEFGCSSYIDVYQEEVLPSPSLQGSIRPAGCHIHVGYDIEDNTEKISDFDINIILGRAMDFFLGIPSDEVMCSRYRRDNYGKLGSIRMTSYGLEYRSLGGYFANDEFLEWQYIQTKKAIEFVSNEDNYEKLTIIPQADKRYYDFLEIDINEQIPVFTKIEA